MAVVPFDAFWLCVSTLLITSAGSLARLRKYHPRVWIQLGQPRLLPFGNWEGSRALSGFYWSRRPARLGDPTLARWIWAQRAGQLALLVVLAVLIAGPYRP